MQTEEVVTRSDSRPDASRKAVNGPVLACLLSAGLGTFAMGAVVVAGEVGLFAAPSLYAPAGGVSGRTTIAVLIWIAAWAILQNRWKHRQVDARRASLATIALIGLGLLGTFPPFWALL